MNLLDVFQTVCIILIGAVVVRKTGFQMPLSRKGAVVVDSCVLIDGRITALVSSGFFSHQIYIPSFIISELQQLADGVDSYKRERARYGLDTISTLISDPRKLVRVITVPPVKIPVDDQLIAFAIKYKATLFTSDFNLAKVATTHEISVLNINELTQLLKPLVLPGEEVSLLILQKGNTPKQGVGYLDDGTMVVVDGAAGKLGKTVFVEITRVHQTVAGRMLFARITTRTSKTK